MHIRAMIAPFTHNRARKSTKGRGACMQSEPIAYNLRHLNDKRKKTAGTGVQVHPGVYADCCIMRGARAAPGPRPYFAIVLSGIWIETPRGREPEEVLLC